MPGQIVLVPHPDGPGGAGTTGTGADPGPLAGWHLRHRPPDLVVASTHPAADPVVAALDPAAGRDRRWEAEPGGDARGPVHRAFAEVAAKVDGGGVAVVIGSGAVMRGLVGDLLGMADPAPLAPMRPWGMTTLNTGDLGAQLVAYDDTSHLPDGSRSGRGTELLLIRHGQSTANLERRWQGHGDWPLTRDGLDQATRLGAVLPPLDALYASPLLRARDTAVAIADQQGREVRYDESLKEIGFGSWENLTTDEIVAADPEGWRTFTAGSDVARGGTGETFASVRRRMIDAIGRIVDGHPGGTVGVVSHGGASRAYLSAVLGLGYGDNHRIHTLENTAFAEFEIEGRSTRLTAWNRGPHLLDRG